MRTRPLASSTDRRALALTLSLLLALIVWPRVAQGQAEVRVLENRGDHTFAEALTFALSAEGETPIEDVELYYTIGDDDIRNRRVPTFEPGNAVRAEHRETLARGQIAPTLPVTWWWRLEDADGNQVETERQTLRYIDATFDWQTLEGDDVRVWYYDADRDFATLVQDAARTELAGIAATLNVEPERRIEIVTYQSQADMRRALVGRGEVYEARLATLGARVSDEVLLIDAQSSGQELPDILAHELSHLVVNLHLDEPYLDAPLWLDEGLAMYNEGQLDPEEQQMLETAIAQDQLMSVRSLTSFPGQTDLVPLAYAQSRDIVRYLIERHGQDDLRALLDALATGQLTTDEALQEVYGVDQLTLYQDYRADVGLPPAEPPSDEERAETPRRAPAAEREGNLTDTLCGSLALLPLAALAALNRRRRPAIDARHTS